MDDLIAKMSFGIFLRYVMGRLDLFDRNNNSEMFAHCCNSHRIVSLRFNYNQTDYMTIRKPLISAPSEIIS